MAHGVLGVPADIQRTGWWKDGQAPGATTGSVLIAGHVDSAKAGAGAFFRLVQARAGDIVEVTAADGKTFRYRVTSTRRDAEGRPAARHLVADRPGAARARHLRRAVRQRRRAATATTSSSRRFRPDRGEFGLIRPTAVRIMTVSASPICREEGPMDARRSNAYRRYIALVATAAPSLTERELELLREAADAALFGDADADRASRQRHGAAARAARGRAHRRRAQPVARARARPDRRRAVPVA